MASSLKKLSRDRLNQNMNSVNGEVLSETEDPYALMSEFSSLYSEKLKAIEENCEDPTEAKIRTLQEWVNDLTEQNFVLIKTVEELEKEALNRVNAVSSLALEAKESMHKDLVSQDAMNNLRAFDDRMSVLHEVIEENTKSLDACMKEIDALSRKLAEKSEECDKLRNQNLRLQGLRAGVQGNKEGVDSKLESSRSGRTTQIMRREKAAAEKSLQELQKEASRIKKELKEKLKKLQSPQEKSEALLGEIADHTKRLQDVRSKMTPLQDFLRDNSEVTRSVIRESQRSLVDFQTSGRFQDFHDETQTIQRNPSEEKRSKQSLVAKTPRAEMLIKAVDNTHKDLKKKTEALQSPERKKNRTLPYETAVTVIRFEDLKGEIKNLPTIVVSERVEDSEGAVRTEKSLYDPSAAASSSRVLDPEGSSNIIIPLGRADRFLDESRPALQRLQKLEKELEIVKTSLNRKTVAFQSPDGRRNESLLKDAAVDAINLHDWEEELHGIEHELRERTENILTILEKNSPGPSDRLEELQNELERAQKEVKEKTDALKSSEGRIQALVYETQEAARRLSEMKNKVIKLENDLKCKEDLLSRANLEEMTRKEDMINNLQKSLEKTKADLEKKDEQFSIQKKQKEAIEEEINKMKSSGDSNLLKLKVCDLEKQLKEKKCELTELKKQNQEKGAEIKKLEAKIEKLNCDYNDLRCKHIKTEELLQKSSRREDAFKCEICRLQKELECYQLRVQNQEQRTKLLEDQLADLQSPSCFDDPSRSEEFNEQLRCLLSTIKCKDVEIEKHIEQEKQLCFQISKMEHCVKERDRQMSLMSDTMKKISCELRAKSNKLEKMEEENARNNLQTITRIPAKTQSESAVSLNKQLTTNFQHSLDTFQECKNYIHTVNELESDFDETDKAILNTWNSLKMWSQSSGDGVLKEFGNVIQLCLQGNETLAKLATQVGKTLDKKVDQDNGCNIAYLEGNLIELGRYLTKANMVAPVSDPDVSKEDIVDEKVSLSKKISVVISDSLSLLHDMKRNNSVQVPLHIKECLQDLMVSFSSVIGNKKQFLEKLVSLQKQQNEFLKNFLDRVSEFDSGMSSYHDVAENLKNEIRKLFSVLLTKENQIQKQCDEINNLKALLSSSDRIEHTYDEVSNLRKVVSNKDLQLIEKDEMIHNLRSLNYTLRRTKSSRSSPSINTSTDLGTNLEEKIQQLEDCMLNIKGNLSSVFLYLVKNQEKLTVFEEDARSLVQVLAKTHQEISHFRETSTGEQGDLFTISSIVEDLDNAASKVEQLINVVEIFLCDSEKLDLNLISEVLRRKLMKLMYIAEFIKKSAIQEHSSIRNVIGEKEDFKKQGSNKDDVIRNLTDNLRKAHSDLQALHDEYSHLKCQKEDMELKNQKVMEELQAKISNLQEAASRIQTSDSESLLLLRKTSESQLQKLKQLEKREIALKNALMKKDRDLEISKKEEKELMNLVDVLRSENLNLQSQVNEARHLIITMQQNIEEQKIESDNLKMQLEEMGNLSALQNLEVDRLHKELLSTTVKLDEVKVSEVFTNENYKKLEEELQVLKEEGMNMENNIFSLKDELLKKNDELVQVRNLLGKQKESLKKYLEENQTLKIEHEEDEKIRIKLEYEFEKLKDELQLIQEREYLAAGEIVEKNQAIYQLNLEKSKLESYIQDLETILKERKKVFPLGDEKGDMQKCIIEEKDEIIEYLKMCLNQMRQYIAERDETIKLIEGQLKASTDLLVEDSDAEERVPINNSNRQNIISQRLSAYKSRLHQAMQQNWRLVSMVDKLQNINFTLLSEKTNLDKAESELADNAVG